MQYSANVSLTTLASGSPPQLSVSVPFLGSSWSIGINGGPSGAVGFLVAAPGPPNPIQPAAGITIHPDILRIDEWVLLPIATSLGGFWSTVVPIPFSHSLVGLDLVLQGWFPSPPGFLNATYSNGVRAVFGY